MTMLTVVQIKADESVPGELKRQLDRLQSVDRTPLARWARESFRVGRMLKFSTERIAEMVESYAEDRGYAQSWIDKVLRENGAYVYDTTGKYERAFTPVNYIVTMKGMIRGLSGLKQIDIATIESQKELSEKARPTIIKHVARMGESELREYPRQITNLIAVLKLLDSAIQEKTHGPKLTT
jgi:hypothetical protein